MMRVLYFLYNLLLPLLLLVGAPRYIRRMRRRGQAGYRYKERMGVFDEAVRSRLDRARRPVWIHAVSVGEVKMAEVLIREISRQRPGHDIVLSTSTITGRRLAEAIQNERLTVIYHTLDIWFCVKRAFNLIRPALVVLIEQELWPNHLRIAWNSHIPVWVVNARLSDRSRRRFSKFRCILRPLLEMLNFIGVQSEQEVERFSRCGFPARKLFHTGSLKYDVVPVVDEKKQRELRDLLRGLGWGERDLVVLCGSTHDPEEEMLLEVCGTLDPPDGELRVILVPRHAERAHELVALCQRRGKSCHLKSKGPSRQTQQAPQVLIVDTTGELSAFYGVADINIIGKSFYGIGGQNFLEATRFPHPVVTGPEMSNFKDMVDLFRSREALIQVRDEKELRDCLQQLVSDPSLRSRLGEKACRVMEENCGAAKRQAEMITDFLASEDLPGSAI